MDSVALLGCAFPVSNFEIPNSNISLLKWINWIIIIAQWAIARAHLERMLSERRRVLGAKSCQIWEKSQESNFGP